MKLEIDADLIHAYRALLRYQNRDKPDYTPSTNKGTLAAGINELLYQKLRFEAEVYEKYCLGPVPEEVNRWLKTYRNAERG